MVRESRIGTRKEILDTALDLFLVQGYEATSLREIADRLTITKAALYYHFPAKEQLVVELTRDFLNELGDLVATARAGARQPRQTARIELLAAYLDLFVRHEKIVALLSRNPAAANHPDVGLRARTLVDALTSELAGPEATADDRLRVACAIGAINSVAMSALVDMAKAGSVVLGAAVAALDAEALATTQQPKVGRERPLRA